MTLNGGANALTHLVKRMYNVNIYPYLTDMLIRALTAGFLEHLI